MLACSLVDSCGSESIDGNLAIDRLANRSTQITWAVVQYSSWHSECYLQTTHCSSSNDAQISGYHLSTSVNRPKVAKNFKCENFGQDPSGMNWGHALQLHNTPWCYWLGLLYLASSTEQHHGAFWLRNWHDPESVVTVVTVTAHHCLWQQSGIFKRTQTLFVKVKTMLTSGSIVPFWSCKTHCF